MCECLHNNTQRGENAFSHVRSLQSVILTKMFQYLMTCKPTRYLMTPSQIRHLTTSSLINKTLGGTPAYYSLYDTQTKQKPGDTTVDNQIKWPNRWDMSPRAKAKQIVNRLILQTQFPSIIHTQLTNTPFSTHSYQVGLSPSSKASIIANRLMKEIHSCTNSDIYQTQLILQSLLSILINL